MKLSRHPKFHACPPFCVQRTSCSSSRCRRIPQMDYRWTIFAVARSCKHVATGAELLRMLLPRTPVNRRDDARSVDDPAYNRRDDARSVDDPAYTDTVREDFDRSADLSEAEGWDRRVLMEPRRPGCR